MVLGLFLVPLGILIGFKGPLWLWGNDDHPDWENNKFWANKCGTSFWCAYKWFALRNPTFNFAKYVLGVKARGYILKGNPNIGDKKEGGSYWIHANPFFEYYLIKPYSATRCIRIRFGWKLHNKNLGETCQFCFVINPFMPYSGI